MDDCHATGFLGASGRGTPEYCGVHVDIVNRQAVFPCPPRQRSLRIRTLIDPALCSTLGKAMGGACGGYTAASKPIIDLLRQRSRPYLFSNSLPPVVAAASVAAFDVLDSAEGPRLLQRLRDNTKTFRCGCRFPFPLAAGRRARHARKTRACRAEMASLGFELRPGDHPIVPVMLGDAK